MTVVSSQVQILSHHHAVQRLANLVLAIASAYVCFNSPSRKSLGHIVSDILCLRSWRVFWIRSIIQTALLCVNHQPLGRWLCTSPQILFGLVIEAHCYLHDNPVHSAFCFETLYATSQDANEEAEEIQDETDQASVPRWSDW